MLAYCRKEQVELEKVLGDRIRRTFFAATASKTIFLLKSGEKKIFPSAALDLKFKLF